MTVTGPLPRLLITAKIALGLELRRNATIRNRPANGLNPNKVIN